MAGAPSANGRPLKAPTPNFCANDATAQQHDCIHHFHQEMDEHTQI
ncbi:hypothetical protein Y88_0313 [Novosphingobium nitrogenifigens DSM 19370]|uniref:Uncharacterized protein n=1 Tax=Novosphingobium nitrogenifigens DSM 19370 TaxID=983920 RepID=F1ZAW2_9SPHN|nr:hypothetical protein Y88_0313 [Novosphingobium nitrogenifigens DSM 19370]